MTLSRLKQEILDRKIERTRQEVRDVVRRTPGGTEAIFSAFKHRPTLAEYEEMVIASKYGPGNPLWVNGDFGTEYLLGEYPGALKAMIAQGVDGSGERDLPKHFHGLVYESVDSDLAAISFCVTEPWANLVFRFAFSESLIQFLPPSWSEEDFAWNEERRCYVDVASGTIGITFYTETLCPINELTKGDPPKLLKDGSFIPSAFKSNEHASYYEMAIAPVDRFGTDEPRDQHGVQGHRRQLASGRIVPVREHRRTNPRFDRYRRMNLDEIRHVVYAAYDLDGRLRYIGEGTESRPAHVNSGISHNYKLNEHYFRRGRMRVEVVKTGLSKSEALAIEQLLIRRHASAELWNVKDNEPAPEESAAPGNAPET